MRTVLVVLLAAAALFGQEATLVRLKQEATHMRVLFEEGGKQSEKDTAPTAVRLALRDWIGSRLLQTTGTRGEFRHLEATMQGELRKAGLPDLGFGHVGIELKWQPEVPDALFAVARVSVGCGTDDSIYIYRFLGNGWVRVLDDHPKSSWGYTAAEPELSEQDSQGHRLFLTHYVSVQCGSSWMRMVYSIYRLGAPADAHELLLSGEHGFWRDKEPEFVVKPEELIMEFLDASLDVSIHNRTQIHRYSFAGGVHRLDPVALQPQDFAEEWLTRPWSEMQSRSVLEVKKWHERLHSVGAGYSGVIPCVARPGRWLIALDIKMGQKELREP